MEIRELTTRDRAAFRALRLLALDQDPDSFMMSVEEERAIPRLMIEHVLERPGPANFFLAAFEDGVMIGMVGAVCPSQRKRRHVAEILSLFVRADRRGQGVGRRLMRAALHRLFAVPEIRRVKLQVVADNAGALALYRALGFRETGREPEAYRDAGRSFDLLDMNLAKPETLFA